MTEQGSDLAFTKLDVDVVKDGSVTNVHAQAGYFKERRHAGSHGSEGLQNNPKCELLSMYAWQCMACCQA